MNKKLFGTDGIRCLANNKIFDNLSLDIFSRAIVNNQRNLKIVIGRDTRQSSKVIEKMLINGLKKNGATIYLAGLISTPAISYFTKQQAPLTNFLDNIFLGWLVRIIFNPIIFLPRYLLAFKLFFLVWNAKIQ